MTRSIKPEHDLVLFPCGIGYPQDAYSYRVVHLVKKAWINPVAYQKLPESHDIAIAHMNVYRLGVFFVHSSCQHQNGNDSFSIHFASTTITEQQSNMRSNVMVSLGGDKATVSEAARRLGILRSTIATRMRRGWSEEMALSTPVVPKKNQSLLRT